MDMEGIWKMVVDSSAIIIVGTIVAAVIAGLFGMGRVQEKVEKVKEVLNKDHEGLEKTISKGNEQVAGSIKDTLDKVGAVESRVVNIDKILAVEAKTKELLYQSLDKDQQEIKRHVEGINALVRNWEEVNARNKELERQVKELIVENERLKSKYDQLLVEMKGLKTKDKEMER